MTMLVCNYNDFWKAVVDARHKDEAQLAAVARNERTRADKQRVPRGKDIGEKKVVVMSSC